MLRSFSCAAGATETLSQRQIATTNQRNRRQGHADSGDTDAISAQGDELVVGGEPAENEQNGGEQAPGDGEDQRKGQNVGDERDQVFDRNIVVNEQRKQLAQNVPDNENQTENEDGKENVNRELATDRSIDEFHSLSKVVWLRHSIGRIADISTFSPRDMIRITFVLAMFIVTTADGQDSTRAPLRPDCGQCLVVTTASWSATSGNLVAFERNRDDIWRPRGDKISVRLGRAGLAWGRGLFSGENLPGPHKSEGDSKAPAGIFDLLFSFGYEHSAPESLLRYYPITRATVTVDDPQSHFYNQMIEANSVRHPDWKSAEQMRLPDDRYKWGIVVGHNSPPIPGAGSAIFLHVWKNSATTTVGCTAMPEKAMYELLRWLDPAKHPALIQMPWPIYRQLEKAADLPPLPR